MQAYMDIHLPLSLLFFPAGLFFFIFIMITRFRSFKSLDSNKKLPPQPWKLPLIGHIHHLLGAPPHHALRNIAQKLGPIVGLQLGHVSAILISSPPLAKEIMKTHDLSFATRPKILGLEVIAYGDIDIAFAPYGDYWRQMRKICVLELLSAKKVQSFRSIREEGSWDLVEYLATQRLKTINLSNKIFTMNTTIICRVTVGSRCKDEALLLELINELIVLTGGFDFYDLYPSIKLLPIITGTMNKMMKMHKKIDAILESVILEHKERRLNGQTNNDNEEDLLDFLMRLKDDDSLQFPLNYDNIKAVMLNVFLAGTDTSSVTVEWAMSELMKNPRVMKKAQDEIRQALKGKTKIDESDIQELAYLKQVIKETFRLHPPLPFLLPRECRESCEIGGYHIPVNTKVIINTWMMGRDPDYWTEPESFIPERFSETSGNMMGTDFEYLPFGAGRRMCPGMLLGLANAELPLAMLLYHFDWELPTSEDLDMIESFGSVLKRKNDLLLVPHPYDTDNYHVPY